MFLSIVVPAYNVEKYIDRCIDSLENQNIEDYEIIIINDCSTDDTLNIVNKRVKQNVKVIDKKTNTGLSDTRNIGIEVACGEFIMLVDSDDYIQENVLLEIKKFVLINDKPDVVYLGYYLEKNGEVIKHRGFISDINTVFMGKDFLKSELKNRCLPIPACFAIYKKEFLLNNNMRFAKGLLHEDELWTPIILDKAERVGTMGLFFYHYQIHENSITQKKDKTKNGLDMLTICNILSVYASQIEDLELKRLMNNHIAMIYMKGMCRGRLYRREYKSNINRFFPLQNAYFIKDRIKSIIFAFNMKVYYYLDIRLGHNI